jgi:hypothetical protein
MARRHSRGQEERGRFPLPLTTHRRTSTDSPGKKPAEVIQQEVAREINQLLQLIFSERRKTVHLDLEAIEMAIRSALHQAGAAALTELLQFAPPAPEQRRLARDCGHTANYLELRSKTVLTAVGKAQMRRPYYLCPHCHQGQFPADAELDVIGSTLVARIAGTQTETREMTLSNKRCCGEGSGQGASLRRGSWKGLYSTNCG